MLTNMEKPFHFTEGKTPVLVSMPHCGTQLLPSMGARLTEEANKLPDTDWYIPELYDFLARMQVSVISATYSRFVVDLNRPPDNAPLYKSKTTGLFPEILFSGNAVFHEGQALTEEEKDEIRLKIWRPYHQKIAEELERLKSIFGYAILFDAHSIAAMVPMLFEGRLPDFNFGNNDGHSCALSLLDNLSEIAAKSEYSHVCNGRFKGGYITRCYGKPEDNIHAIQLELSQLTYLDVGRPGYQIDVSKKDRLGSVLASLIASLLDAGNPFDSEIQKN